ncbi:hypothetical protein N4P33_23635 [Streptomyces sp. 15-116A]|uniref:hypothetical protein n=1 Tax=Streptomyces sp. 15-116A TaxID=2259035 RepID=UPI0021B2E86F|nr:hypothetical protein [Streptomyces sp. 15-116A]MCT7355121.1 hypothetical protein [Streptomyces sp. 15-116A]
MAWDEWEKLKASAAERSTGQMQLNQLSAESGGGRKPDLISNKPAWTKAGTDIGSLSEDISKATRKLEDGQTGLGKEAGCLTAAAQKEVYGSWETYVNKVSRRCERLSGLLVKAGNDQLRTDEAVEAALGRLEVAYADTPAVGGQNKGR